MLSISLRAAKESPLISPFVCGVGSIVGFERETELPSHSQGEGSPTANG